MKPSPPLTLSLLIPIFLAVGFMSPLPIPSVVVIGGIGVATFLTVVGLSQGWHSRMSNYASASQLLVVNIVAGSVPLVLVGMLLGISSPMGLGFMILASMPVAAGLPAYATTLGVRAERITLFTLMSYGIALLGTPIAVSVLLDESVTRTAITSTIIFGLIVPTILGISLAKPMIQISPRSRKGVTIAVLLLSIFGVGTQIGADFVSGISTHTAVVVVAIALLRAPFTAALGVGLSKLSNMRIDPLEAALAGGYRNCALAAVIAIAAGLPEAAIPGAIGLASEALLLLSLTALSRQQRSRRREKT